MHEQTERSRQSGKRTAGEVLRYSNTLRWSSCQELVVYESKKVRVVFVNVESIDSEIASVDESSKFISDNHLEGRLLPVIKLCRASEVFFYEGTLTSPMSVRDWVVDNCSGDSHQVRGSSCLFSARASLSICENKMSAMTITAFVEE